MKTAVDIHTCLESEGYDISYGTVLRTIKSLVHTQKEAFIKAEHQPGQVCEFDWGEVKLIIDGQKEPYKWLYLRPHTVILEWPICSLNKTECFQEAHALFFQEVNGVFHTMVYDNMRVAVKNLLEMKRTDRSFSQTIIILWIPLSFCNPASGNEKGM